METPIHIAECQEPWIYWWESLAGLDKDDLRRRHFRGEYFLSGRKIKTIWEKDAPDPLPDHVWVGLADVALEDRYRFTAEQQKEIWRQVYRIASDRI